MAEDLIELAESLVGRALPGEQVEVIVSRATSTTVRVYAGEVESLTSADSSGAGVRIIRDGRLGFAHCGSLDPQVLADTLIEARDNSAFGEPDEFNGLAVPDGVEVVARDAWSDAVVSNPVDRKVELALELERRVLGIDPRVTGARSTAFGDAWGESAIVSTAGIRRTDRGASCSVSTQPLARHEGETQAGSAHDGGRDPVLAGPGPRGARGGRAGDAPVGCHQAAVGPLDGGARAAARTHAARHRVGHAGR